MSSYNRNAGLIQSELSATNFLPLILAPTQNCQIDGSFGETCGVTNYGSGWRKNAGNRILVFADSTLKKVGGKKEFLMTLWLALSWKKLLRPLSSRVTLLKVPAFIDITQAIANLVHPTESVCLSLT